MKLIFSKKRLELFKNKALHWADTHEVFCFLDSNAYSNDEFSKFDFLIAIGAKRHFSFPNEKSNKPFKQLEDFHQNSWLFGFLSYELKNYVEQLSSKNDDSILLPDAFFFEPQVLIKGSKDGVVNIEANYPVQIFDAINLFEIKDKEVLPPLSLQAKIKKEAYLHKIEQVKKHIHRGDIFEMNFCQEFFNKNAKIHPIQTFQALNTISKAPFASFLKHYNQYLISSSPERFLQKNDDLLISQPIKGTRKRGKNSVQDLFLSHDLSNSSKDKSENVMIVDLVRNDLSKVCKAGSVQVKDLFGIYPFEQVIQMISTVVGNLEQDYSLSKILNALFPMGSMTGAPKVRAMQLIESLEESKRGLYSGSVGYIQPNGDFDFNVVIRSILYNALKQYVSVQVGGAIVQASEAEAEYEECLIKASAMIKVLENHP